LLLNNHVLTIERDKKYLILSHVVMHRFASHDVSYLI